MTLLSDPITQFDHFKWWIASWKIAPAYTHLKGKCNDINWDIHPCTISNHNQIVTYSLSVWARGNPVCVISGLPQSCSTSGSRYNLPSKRVSFTKLITNIDSFPALKHFHCSFTWNTFERYHFCAENKLGKLHIQWFTTCLKKMTVTETINDDTTFVGTERWATHLLKLF